MPRVLGTLVFAAALIAAGQPALAQIPPPQQQAAQPQPQAPSAPSPKTPQGLFAGASRHVDLSNATLALSLDDAISQGLAYNVGLLEAGKIADEARAARLEQLSALLPTLDADLRISRQKTNLQALGISFPNVPPTVTVNNIDARVSGSVPLVDLHALASTRSAASHASAAEWNARDARETVVLAIATMYLQAASAEATLASAVADRDTAQSLYELARDREQSGLTPNIDTLRAHVELQTRQQGVTEARRSLDQQRLALLRIVGLPLAQKITLTAIEYQPMPSTSAEDGITRALAARADVKAADADVRAAEEAKHAAELQRVPSARVVGDIGELGTTPSNALTTWSIAGVLKVPIFEGGRIQADVLRASAALDQRKAERDDLRISAEQQVRAALIDVASAEDEVALASSRRDLASQTLVEARDRFAAGVTNNIEVVQAQQAVVQANSEYLRALEAHNVAKLSLARAMGDAEKNWRDLLRK